MENVFYPNFAFFPGIGPSELLIIFWVLLLLFGGKKLPELARGLGRSFREFKKATNEIEDDFRSTMDQTELSKPTKKPENTVESSAQEADKKKEAS